MYWLNGQPATDVPFLDRSFQYGDGCFTTILTKNGIPQQWPLHIERMAACLSLLGIDEPKWQLVYLWLENAALKSPLGGVKLHISRGVGGRGYNPVGVGKPMIAISCFPYPSHYLEWQQNGVHLGVCQNKLGIMPSLAGHKHNNRLEQILLRAELEEQGYQDGVACDLNNHVVETTMANLFWCKDKVLYTPSLKLNGVAGITRKRVLNLATEWNLQVEIGQFKMDNLLSATEVFITNAVLEVAPVTGIASSTFQVGQLTRRFQESFDS